MRFTPPIGALALAAILLAACGSTATTSSPTNSTSPATGITDSAMPGMDHGSTAPSASSGSTPMSGSMDMSHEAPVSGLTIKITTTEFAATKSTDLAFMIVGNEGKPVTTYEVEQTKELHLVLVRSDLSGYQHLHPTRRADGTWTIPVTFATGGTYRMVADFVPVLDGKAAGRTAVTTDLKVTGTGADAPLPAVSTTTTVDGYTVAVSGSPSSVAAAKLAFTVTDGANKPVTLEPYLGSFGHLVAFAQSDLAYTHIHPSSADKAAGTLEFTGKVAAPGTHRLYMQFAAAGKVHTAELTAVAT